MALIFLHGIKRNLDNMKLQFDVGLGYSQQAKVSLVVADSNLL